MNALTLKKEFFQSSDVDQFDVFDITINNSMMREAVEWATTKTSYAKNGVFVNAHSINMTRKFSTLKDTINSADKVFADGTGIRMAAKRVGEVLLDNVNGTDMLPKLCARAASKGLSIFLLGAEPGVADAMADNLNRRFPTLRIAGTQHGYFNKEGEENALVVDRINASNADIVLVGFGSPIQEAWLENNRNALRVSTVLAVGGLFDFYSGRIPRAPVWMRNAGIEWVWRLLQEPKSKFERYVIGNPLFLWEMFKLRRDNTGGISSGKGLSLLLQRMGAAFILLSLSPVFLSLITAVRLTSQGPVFYHQIRVGKYGKRFKFYKFRSMYLSTDPKYREPEAGDNDRDGICKKFFNDPRITPVGRFIRKYSLDELPQLWHVLTGDMALVGPRPALVEEVEAYQHDMVRRFDVTPGLTGLWQVSGRADTTFEEQISLDLDYVNKRSWWSDIEIIFKTVPAVLLAKGAY